MEDDVQIAGRLKDALAADRFVVDHATDGDSGWYLGNTEPYDAAILDLGLAKLPGLQVLKRWRADGRNMPVLILTGRHTWTERVAGLDAGADDYLGKPFQMPEVVARVRALVRRATGSTGSTLRLGDLALDTVAKSVSHDGKPIELTAKEFQILKYFMQRQGRVLSQNEIVDHVYSMNEALQSNTIEVHVGRLRKKIGRDLIKTVRGLGYRLG